MSFVKAAKELSVTQSAISRQVKNLEDRLGIQLFRRLTRALELTEIGRDYYPTLRDSFERIEQATTRILNDSEGGILTISVLPTIAMRWLMPRLVGFTQSNPGIEIRLSANIRPVNFGSDNIDVAIRVGDPKPRLDGEERATIDLMMTDDWSGVRADFLMPDVLVPLCSPTLRDGNPPLRCADDLRHHTLLHTTTRPNAWADWFRVFGLSGIDPTRGPAYGHFFMTIQAAASGRGVAVIPRVLVAEDLAAGRVVIPFPCAGVQSEGGYYLMYRDTHRNMAKIRVFREWLQAECRDFCDATQDPDG